MQSSRQKLPPISAVHVCDFLAGAWLIEIVEFIEIRTLADFIDKSKKPSNDVPSIKLYDERL